MSLFHEGGRGQEKTTLSLLKNVTISLGGVGVKVNLDNVTNFTGFFFEGVPNSFFKVLSRDVPVYWTLPFFLKM